MKKAINTSLERHPNNTPLEEWPPAWLKLEVASMLDNPMYIIMHDWEKTERGLPATEDEMRAYIKAHRSDGPAASAPL